MAAKRSHLQRAIFSRLPANEAASFERSCGWRAAFPETSIRATYGVPRKRLVKTHAQAISAA
jgi:hypothetical protein